MPCKLCDNSGYVSDGSGIAFNNLKPCPNGCEMFKRSTEEFTLGGSRKPKGVFLLNNHADRLLYGDLERGEC